MDEQFRVENCGIKIEIGDNLLMAIKDVLKKTKTINMRTLGLTLSPGKEIQRAFGINLTEMYRLHENIKKIPSNERKKHD